MKRFMLLTGPEADSLKTLGQRIAQARLRRNLSQQEMADRCDVTRKTYVALEQGKAGVSIGLLVKTMGVLGYPERVGDLLLSDPEAEGLEALHGRKRARMAA